MTQSQAAPTLPVLYQALEVVNADRHGALRLLSARRQPDLTGIAALPLAVEEIALVGRQLPVLFAEQAPHMPVALLRLAPGQPSPAVEAEGHWRAGRYQPAHLRRHPFLMVPSGKAEELVLCLDPLAPCLSVEAGDPLYAEDGQPAAALQQAFALARDAEAAFRRTRAFCEALTTLGLLSASTARVQPARPGAAAFDITGFRAVDRAALAKLDGAALAGLRDAGHLEAIYAHLASIHGFSEMS
ncbi:SapC family protein [Roseomonas sp. F4]